MCSLFFVVDINNDVLLAFGTLVHIRGLSSRCTERGHHDEG
jgi:hypothetical protein